MTITKKVSKILLFSFGLIEILLNCKTVNAATNADSSTEVVANYELSSIPADTLKEMLISHKLLLKVLYHLIYQPFRGFR